MGSCSWYGTCVYGRWFILLVRSIKNYQLTIFYLFILLIFSLAFKDNLPMYVVMSIVTVLTTFMLENAFFKEHSYQESKGKVAIIFIINIAIFIIFTTLIFS